MNASRFAHRNCRLAVACAGALAFLGGGCSFIFTRGGSYPRCSTSAVPPVLDTLVGGFQVARTAFAIGAPDETYEDFPISREVDIALGLGFSALFIASAYYGYSTTNDCAAKEPTTLQLDESRDVSATFRGKPAAPAPSQPQGLRAEIRLGEWQVALTDVLESEPHVVSVRIETRFRAQRFKDCRELQIIHAGTLYAQQAYYQADLVGDLIREVVTARVPVSELTGVTTSAWSSLAVCDHHQLVNGAAQARIGSFLQQRATRRGSSSAPALAVQPAGGPPRAVVIKDANLTLSQVAIRVHRQPSAVAQHAFVMLDGVRMHEPGCETLEITLDADKTSKPLRQRAGTDPVPFVALQTEFVSRLAASSSATLGLCGRVYKLSPPDRAALGALASDLKPAAVVSPALSSEAGEQAL